MQCLSVTMVTQGMMKQWEGYIGEVKRSRGEKLALPSYEKVLKSTELVLDDQGELREVNRVAGENEVGTAQHSVNGINSKF